MRRNAALARRLSAPEEFQLIIRQSGNYIGVLNIFTFGVMAKGWGMLLAAFVVLIGRLSSIEVAAQPSFNRTEGVVELGTCQGLKSKVELGLDIDIILNSDIVCTETISLSANQIVRISSAANEEYLIAVAEDFAVPDPTSSSLLLVPAGASLSLEQLRFTNEAGVQGSPGAVRAIWNLGTLDVNTCTFESLNYAAIQDGGAVSFDLDYRP